MPISDLAALAYITADSEIQQALKLGDFILQRAEMLTETDLKVCLDAFERSKDHEKLEAFEQITRSNLP